MLSKNTSLRMLALCLWLLVLVCSHVSAEAQFSIRGVVKSATGTVSKTASKVATVATVKAEGVVEDDINNDGQIGKFRAQEGEVVDGRQVAKDSNGAKRFEVSRPRTGARSADEPQQEPAGPAPKLRK